MPRTHIDPSVKQLLVTMRARASVQHIHELTQISVRTVQRTLQTFRETGGDVVRKPVVPGRPRMLTSLDIAYLEALVERQPDATLEELRQYLEIEREVETSVYTIRRSLLDRGLSRKRLARYAHERDEEDRAEYQRIVGMFYRADQFVCVDESACDRRTPRREFGWAPVGTRARKRDFFIRGKRYSILPALTLDGIIHCNILDTPVTARLFNDFVEGLLNEMNPFPGTRSVLVMDNASIHKSAELREMVEARGMRILFLPAYSPDFNPIEEAFSSIKAYVRRNRDWALYELGGAPHADPWAMLFEAVYSVTPEDAQGWFRDSNYIV